jgi:hypothetical protein
MAGQSSKKTYQVRVTRTYVHDGIVEVEASDRREAELLAYDMIDSIDLAIDYPIEGKDTAEVMG